jgi:hypothetical protein
MPGIRTLRNASDHILKPPKAAQQLPPDRTALEALICHLLIVLPILDAEPADMTISESPRFLNNPEKRGSALMHSKWLLAVVFTLVVAVVIYTGGTSQYRCSKPVCGYELSIKEKPHD